MTGTGSILGCELGPDLRETCALGCQLERQLWRCLVPPSRRRPGSASQPEDNRRHLFLDRVATGSLLRTAVVANRTATAANPATASRTAVLDGSGYARCFHSHTEYHQPHQERPAPKDTMCTCDFPGRYSDVKAILPKPVRKTEVGHQQNDQLRSMKYTAACCDGHSRKHGTAVTIHTGSTDNHSNERRATRYTRGAASHAGDTENPIRPQIQGEREHHPSPRPRPAPSS